MHSRFDLLPTRKAAYSASSTFFSMHDVMTTAMDPRLPSPPVGVQGIELKCIVSCGVDGASKSSAGSRNRAYGCAYRRKSSRLEDVIELARKFSL
jgi:hypothetical protein